MSKYCCFHYYLASHEVGEKIWERKHSQHSEIGGRRHSEPTMSIVYLSRNLPFSIHFKYALAACEGLESKSCVKCCNPIAILGAATGIVLAHRSIGTSRSAMHLQQIPRNNVTCQYMSPQILKETMTSVSTYCILVTNRCYLPWPTILKLASFSIWVY